MYRKVLFKHVDTNTLMLIKGMIAEIVSESRLQCWYLCVRRLLAVFDHFHDAAEAGPDAFHRLFLSVGDVLHLRAQQRVFGLDSLQVFQHHCWVLLQSTDSHQGAKIRPFSTKLLFIYRRLLCTDFFKLSKSLRELKYPKTTFIQC